MSNKNNRWPAIVAGLGAAAAAAGGALALSRRGQQQAADASHGGPGIVVLGAGFAGLTAAWKLSDRLAGRARITLVDLHNYHLFTPMLYQVATLGVDPYTVAFPVRDFTGSHGVTFRRGITTGIDFDGKKVQLEDGSLEYDYLVIALGATTNFFGNQPAQEHAFQLPRSGAVAGISRLGRTGCRLPFMLRSPLAQGGRALWRRFAASGRSPRIARLLCALPARLPPAPGPQAPRR